MVDQYEQEKSSSGGLSTNVFLITAVVLFIAGPGFAGVFSWRGAGFVVAGMFAAALVVGMPMYLLERGISKVLVKSLADPFSESAVRTIKALGVVLLLLQVMVTVGVTYWAFKYVFP